VGPELAYGAQGMRLQPGQRHEVQRPLVGRLEDDGGCDTGLI